MGIYILQRAQRYGSRLDRTGKYKGQTRQQSALIMEGKIVFLMLVAATLCAVSQSAPTVESPITTSNPYDTAPTEHPGEPYCRETIGATCAICSPEAQPYCHQRVIRFCRCVTVTCSVNDGCSCSDNTPCAPLE